MLLSGLEQLKFDKSVINFLNVGERCNISGSRKFKRLIKAALFLGVVALAVLYIVQEKASEEWRARADMILKKAEEAAVDYGKDAIEKGRDVLEEHLPSRE